MEQTVIGDRFIARGNLPETPWQHSGMACKHLVLTPSSTHCTPPKGSKTIYTKSTKWESLEFTVLVSRPHALNTVDVKYLICKIEGMIVVVMDTFILRSTGSTHHYQYGDITAGKCKTNYNNRMEYAIHNDYGDDDYGDDDYGDDNEQKVVSTHFRSTPIHPHVETVPHSKRQYSNDEVVLVNVELSDEVVLVNVELSDDIPDNIASIEVAENIKSIVSENTISYAIAQLQSRISTLIEQYNADLIHQITMRCE
tara:strand:- start:4819 stop:5580 length:762 start_codon:yes stop_codon:yes gene_type:complete